MSLFTPLLTLLCTALLPLLLLLAAVKLWQLLLLRGLDAGCASPLPPGTMGLPFIGETLQLILQVAARFLKACFLPARYFDSLTCSTASCVVFLNRGGSS